MGKRAGAVFESMAFKERIDCQQRRIGSSLSIRGSLELGRKLGSFLSDNSSWCVLLANAVRSRTANPAFLQNKGLVNVMKK